MVHCVGSGKELPTLRGWELESAVRISFAGDYTPWEPSAQLAELTGDGKPSSALEAVRSVKAGPREPRMRCTRRATGYSKIDPFAPGNRLETERVAKVRRRADRGSIAASCGDRASSGAVGVERPDG